jgi:hypothetical protein
MMLRTIARVVLFWAFFSLSFGGSARAQAVEPSAEERARALELKRTGDAAMESMHYRDAVDAYVQAYAITKDPALLYNRGRALQAVGDFPGALEALEGFDASAGPALKSRVPKLGELLAEVRSKVATLNVTCNVAGARVLVRDTVVGTTPLRGPMRFNAGAATLEVLAEGYVPHRRTLQLPPGGTLEVEVSLVAKAKAAVLVLRSSVPGTTAIVDGQVAGNPPLEVVVDPGPHKILARAEGYAETETSAIVALGEHKEVDLTFKKNPGITAKWWFWTGIGVAVAGGATVAAALLIEKNPSHGDLAPGIVRAPLGF